MLAIVGIETLMNLKAASLFSYSGKYIISQIYYTYKYPIFVIFFSKMKYGHTCLKLIDSELWTHGTLQRQQTGK